ncbi:hypothetical protein M422DRAFT_774887, partial [Sphaerobolus stellatus SS14]
MTKKILINNSVIFDERYFPGLARNPPGIPTIPTFSKPSEPAIIEIVTDQGGVLPTPTHGLSNPMSPTPPNDQRLSSDSEPEPSYPEPVENEEDSVPSQASSPDPLLLVSPEPSPSPSPQLSAPVRRTSTRQRNPTQHIYKQPVIIKVPPTVPEASTSNCREPSPMIESSDDEDQSDPSLPIDEDEEGVDYEDEAFFTLADGFEFAYRVSAHENCPRTLKEALASPEADKWFDAAKKEVEALLREGTWK